VPLFLPFFLLRLVIKASVFIVVLPFVVMAAFIGIAVAFVAVCLALLVPLLPFAFLVFCVWAVVRAASRPALAA
jgi:type III secretory pathway component EscS